MGEGKETPADFYTPAQARNRLKSLGYDNLIHVPKESHYLHGLFRIASSDQGASLGEVIKDLQATDPKHQRRLSSFIGKPDLTKKIIKINLQPNSHFF